MRRVAPVSVAVLVGIAVGGVLIGACEPGSPVHSRGEHPAPTRIRVAWSTVVRGWPSQLSADRRGVVAVSGNRFVASLAPGDGSTRWETEVHGSLHPFMEPAIDARSVLVSAGDRFVMLDRSDGAIRWEASTTAAPSGVALVPSVGDGTVVVTADSGGILTGRDAPTGASVWTVGRDGRLDTHLAGDPVTGAVLAVWQTATDATIRAIDVASGALRWEQRVEPWAASPVVAGDLVIVAAGDGDYTASVRAMALTDGAIRWHTPVPASFEPGQIPGVADVSTARRRFRHGAIGRGVVGVQDHLGTVSLLDLRTGALRWRSDTGVPALGGRLLVTSDAVLVRNEGQQLVVLDRSRGSVRRRWADPDGLPEGIASVGDRVFVGWRRTEPGRIDALEIAFQPSRH